MTQQEFFKKTYQGNNPPEGCDDFEAWMHDILTDKKFVSMVDINPDSRMVNIRAIDRFDFEEYEFNVIDPNEYDFIAHEIADKLMTREYYQRVLLRVKQYLLNKK